MKEQETSAGQTVYLLHHLIHALSVYGDIDQVLEAVT